MIKLLILSDAIEISGELAAEGLPAVVKALNASNSQLNLRLGDLDITDGSAMAGLTRLLADALDSGRRLTLIEPPQLIVHNLYRVGRHPHSLLEVVNMREEEAYG